MDIRARLAEISAKLEDFGDELTDGQMTEINALSEEFETLTAKLEASEKLDAMKAKASQSTRKVAPAAAAPQPTIVRDAKDRFGGFNSTGDFLSAVKNAASGKIATQFQSAMYEKSAESGGFLLPEELSTQIAKVMETSEESLLAKTTTFRLGGNSLTIPVDEEQPWNGGIQAYWTGEGKLIRETQPKLGAWHSRLHKLAALVRVSEELNEDAVALESLIKAKAPAAIMYKVNSAILIGDGVGKPTGILKSPFTVTIAKEASQPADSINYQNILKMYAAMIPSARNGAAWYINAGMEAALWGMKDDQGNLIYLSPGSQLNTSPYGILMGRPVIPMMTALPGIGDVGDILFANMSYYYSAIKSSGIKQATSIHLDFDRDMIAYRFTMRVDGSVPFKAPVTTEFGGHKLSAFVVLADRA